ncbi:MAG TPA: zinc-ribbon domain containing protein [Planctomycetota bacterium]|jgi:CxxC-x17-CxxC domain-containing protein|nr:zinc-ribbon domain containing protein [Planctomycetota bacterium]
MELQDKMIVCEDCGKEFPHTVEDQKRYAERGFTADPKRCRECRQARKDKQAMQKPAGAPRRPGGGGRGPGGPRPYGQGGGGGFRQSRPAPRRDRDFSGGGAGGFGGPPRQSFDVICAACGAPTTVPFEPRQGREVFCRSCFKKMREE